VTLYKVASTKPLDHDDPLHWSRFYPDKQRHHHGTMARRQDLILYLANLHARALDSGMPLGMIRIPIRLTSLRQWVRDYRPVLDAFFEVDQLGYNLGDADFELSTLIPRNVVNGKRKASDAARELVYVPPERVETETVTKVFIQQQNRDVILKTLALTNRLDLRAPVEFLLSEPEFNFHFIRAGRLQQRDTSVWPVAAVETWPSWLREWLFGRGVDIDAAYTQFLLEQLNLVYADKPHLVNMLFPDIVQSLHHKSEWRAKLCMETLGLPWNDDNIGVVKRICMSLANGSRISPAILSGGRAYSVTADIVVAATDDVSLLNFERIGTRLKYIAEQYATARKVICTGLQHRQASRENQKEIFGSYFAWERDARYKIWEECGKCGIMVHDGIDGVPQEYLDRMPEIMRKLGILLS
jgi:hypothetical protein